MSTLAEMAIGEHARITQITTTETGYRRKLLALGLIPGTEVELRRVAPLGDPIEIYLRGFRLSLRREEASILEVEPIHNEKI